MTQSVVKDKNLYKILGYRSLYLKEDYIDYG